MTIQLKTIAAVAVLTAAAFAPVAAKADYYNPPHDVFYRHGFDGPGSPHTQVPYGFDKSRDQDKVTVVRPGAYGTVVISEQDRKSIKGFQERSYRSECPQGTKKIGRECSTDRNQNLTYVVGQPLPPTIVVTQPPAELVTVIHQPPVGYRYMQVGSDLLLVNQDGVVVDAVAY